MISGPGDSNTRATPSILAAVLASACSTPPPPGTESSDALPPAPPAVAADDAATEHPLIGKVMVNVRLGYIGKVVALTMLPDGEYLELAALDGQGSFQVATDGIENHLRPPVDEAGATELEKLITHGAPAEPYEYFDLRLYILGTPQQAAAAVATLMDRTEDPDQGPGATRSSSLGK